MMLMRTLVIVALAAALAAACGDAAVEPTAPVEAPPAVAPTSSPATPIPAATSTVRIAPVPSDAAQPSELPALPGGASGFTHFVFERVGDQIITSLVEGPRGSQLRIPLSLSDLRDLLASEAPIPDELEMTRDELASLVAELEEIRTATERYSDINVALADGYVQSTNIVPNMGAHFNNYERIIDGRLVLSEPEILMYDRDETGEWRLIGTSFVLPYQLTGDDHPSGFTGSLDNWHMHYSLCTGGSAIATAGHDDGGFIVAGTTTSAACAAAGGTFVDKYGWMIHAWVHDDNPLGVFSMWNPNVPPLTDAAAIRAPRDQVDGDSTVVTIENFALGSITIAAGERVTWLNADGVPHTVTSADGAAPIDSDLIGPGQSFASEFTTPGSFSLVCSIHPSMNGTVTVVE